MKLCDEIELFQQNSDYLNKKLNFLHKKLALVERNQKRAEMILSHIHEGLLFINFQGRIEECNKTAALLLNVNSEEILAQPFWGYFEDSLFGFSMKEMLEKKCEKKHLILSLFQQEKHVQVEVNSALIPEQGLILILRDRSEINTLEKTIRENERLHALGEMAATLAHEIRNPLGGITGFTSLLLKDPKKTSTQEQMLRAILEGTHMLNTLVTNVLEYSRPCILNFASINLQECLKEVLSYLPIEESSRVIIKCSNKLFIIADKIHFKRALLNLIQNGLEASVQEKKLFLIAKKEGVLTIKDQGIGIPKEHLEKIMTPFFTTKIKGTGLGLSEVNKIIRAHGFRLTIDSNKKGTQIRIFYKEGHK